MEVIECQQAFKTIDGKFGFFCMKGIVRMNDQLYLASWHQRRETGIELADLFNVKQLQTEDRGPKLQPSWKVAVADTSSTGRGDSDSDHYVKAPKLSDYAPDFDLEFRMQLEIQVCEILRHNPHPNIATYHGCRAVHGRASALCFNKYEKTLLEAMNPQGLNKRHFMSSGRPLVGHGILRALDQLLGGIRHLHSLDLVHNDIAPANIMWDETHQTLVLIDFGSCRHVGEQLRKTATGRTHEWHDPAVDSSTPDNDMQAFAELKTWLSGSVDDLQW
ncbi:Uu.00g009260.m01.CDS01 [Anthostomella pinea]|uniref:Uu.00g009260.m01.CDS01 n=1 Tax=Anthostomella pinea TaxID=933095 RepID=A0AAI8VXC8_9PEZI|nr:Uu.00g009260.m01.CDS01 [Anthostomella pinea]